MAWCLIKHEYIFMLLCLIEQWMRLHCVVLN